MFKTVAIAALGFAAVSAQFLNERLLQNVTNFASACSWTAAAGETGCNTAGYCCMAYTRAGVAGTPANLCLPTDFAGQNLTIAANVFAFRGCLNANATVTARTTCVDSTTCGPSSCCANVTLFAGATTGVANNGTLVRRFCTAGTAQTIASATYTAASWAAGNAATVNAGVCTANAAVDTGSFGSYIKASMMVVVAVLSVAFF